ncbi:MAG: asparagine synthase (glutamine-hydrolyzing) [Nitrososphaeraceae archaeon]
MKNHIILIVLCGIAGLRSKSSLDIVPMVKTMLNSIEHRGPDGFGLSANTNIYHSFSIEKLSNNIHADSALGHVRLAIVGGKLGQQPFKSCDGRFILEHNGEIYNYKQIKKRLLDHKFTTKTDSEVIVHLLEENCKKTNNFMLALQKTINELDGVYALSIIDQSNDTIYLIRDKLGIRQLYYAENSKLIAFASERKALWEIGLNEPTISVLPGHCICISKNVSNQIRLSDPPIHKNNPVYNNMKNAVDIYEKLLLSSIKKRTQDLKKVGVIFSGGIDSVLIALLVKKFVDNVVCYTSGIEGSPDIEFAKSIANKLNLDLRINELNSRYVENIIPKIINTIETNNMTQVEVAIPIYSAVELAAEDGMKVVFSGQGADELFGGYSWYPNILKKQGYEKLQEYLITDLLLLYKECLEREDKITMAHGIEMRVPFLDPKIVKFATSINLRLNIVNSDDIFGKRVHRELAKKIGLDHSIAYRKKDAAQHGSGIHDVLKKLAVKNGYDITKITDEYSKKFISREKLGSSERYGHLFTNEPVWDTDLSLQLYFDSIVTSNLPISVLINKK